MTNENSERLELPASVTEQLRRFRRGLWWMETVVAILGGAVGALAAYLLLFVSDRLWETPAWLRLGLAVGSVGCGVGFVGYWLDRWGWHRRDARQLASLVQRRYPRLGDRLLGIVELAASARAPANESLGLCRAAMRQVAAEAAELDFAAAVPTRRRRRYGWACAGLAGAVALGIGLLPPAGVNALQRLLHPRSAIGRYTLVHLERQPERQVVAYGEPFAVECRVSSDSRWLPGQAQCRYGNQAWIDGVGTGGSFRFQVPGQTHPGTVSIAVGDARQTVAIQPEFRPDLVKLRAWIEWPEYLRYAALTQDVRNGTVEILAGSRVGFEGQVSRRLQEARLGAEQLPVLDGDRFAVAARAVTNTETLALGWRDVVGLSSREPFRLKLEVHPDEAPVVDCRGLERVVALLQDEVLEFEAGALDDYGVRDVRVTWEAEGTAQTGVAATQGELLVRQGGPREKDVAGTMRFSPLALGLGPQKVTVRASATDFLPGRKPSQSPPYQVYVLDRQEHAKLVQQQFEKLQEKLEEIARAEEDLFEVNQRLRGELGKPEAGERLQEQQRGEESNEEASRRLQEEGTKLLQEAMRNPEIAGSVLQKMAGLLENLQQVSEQGMPQVAQSLARAQAAAKQRPQHLAEAVKRQQEVVEKLRQMLREMNEASDQLMAGNFVNRLRQAAAEEKGVTGGVGELLAQTLGLPVSELPAAPKAKLGRLEQRQAQNQQRVKYIQEDLDSFFNRTRTARIGEVHQEMVKTQVVEELRRLTGLIGQNATGQSVEQSARWSRQLDEWAQHLTVASDGGGGGEGGGSGCQMSPEAMELLMKLARIRQTEERLREQTRLLEQHRTTNPHYGEATEQLARIQQALTGSVQEAGRGWSDARLAQLLEDVAGVMTDAARLLSKPQTDGETVAAETEAIELLADSMERSCSGSGGGAGAAEAMRAMMRRLMGRGAGAQGGGNDQGGDTAGPNARVLGDAAGRAAAPRPVEKAVGRARENVPAEFRDAIEAYINAVEGTK